MNNIFDLKNKIAIVTGGYGYLGESISLTLRNNGAKVFVAGRSIDKFNDKFEGQENIYFVEFDISNIESIKVAFNEIYKEEGNIDVLVNNAYYGASQHPEVMTNDEWEKGIDGGLNSVFRCINEVFHYMKKSNYMSKIINISSMYGMVVPDLNIYEGREHILNPPNYGVAKSGILHLTKYYAMYLAKYNINVNAVSPGAFPPIDVQNDEEFTQRLRLKNPMKRIGTPNDLNGVILLLSSQASNYITGQNIAVDGGWTL